MSLSVRCWRQHTNTKYIVTCSSNLYNIHFVCTHLITLGPLFCHRYCYTNTKDNTESRQTCAHLQLLVPRQLMHRMRMQTIAAAVLCHNDTPSRSHDAYKQQQSETCQNNPIIMCGLACMCGLSSFRSIVYKYNDNNNTHE